MLIASSLFLLSYFASRELQEPVSVSLPFTSRVASSLGVARRFLLLTVIILSTLHASDSFSKDELLSRFPAPQRDFQQHIDQMRMYLLDTQLPSRSTVDVEYNLPFQLTASKNVPYRGKYLLIHGLNDSPAVWRDVARQLVQRGYDVRAILLPGHGNTPNAQLNIRYEMWLDAARAQLEFWRTEGVPFYMGGFSMGGVIASILAVEYDSVDGLLLFAPAYYSTKNKLLRWARLASYFKEYVFGGMIIEDNPTKYNSIPINAAAQYYRTTKYLSRLWRRRQLDMPVLMVESFDDSVVSARHTRNIFEHHFSSPRKRLVLYGNDPVEARANEVLRSGSFPEYRILSQSHQGMMIAPDNPLFGIGGTQRVCNGNEWKVFSACLYYDYSLGPLWFGAEGQPSPDDVPVARTTFNADFKFLFQLYDEVFLEQ